MSFKFSMDPRVSYLSELLKEVSDGVIQIPRFQRDLVWEWSQQRDLLCSIFEGLPIGALLIWRTRLKNIKSYPSIGPFPVSQVSTDMIQTYLMDGLQRVSTLYGMAYYFDPNVLSTDQKLFEKFEVFCDLEANGVDNLFLLGTDINKKDKIDFAYRFMRLNLVFNTRELLRFQRQIPPEKENLIEKIEEIVSSFKNYKVPVIPLETDDQELVTKSFERINSRGTTMSETHMLNALSYSDNFDLLATIEKQREQYLSALPNWRELDVNFVLLLLKTKLGFDPYFKKTDEIAKEIRLHPESLSQVFQAIENLSKFSEEYLDIDHPTDFPYRLQMLGIASEFFYADYETKTERLKSWFWISTYTNSFGTTARNSQKSLEDLRSFITTGILPWTLNLEPVCRSLKGLDINYKSARTKAWASALASRLDENTNDFKHKKLLNKYKGASLSQPTEFQADGKRPGNCFLVDPKLSRNFSIAMLSEDERISHFIDQAIYQLFISGDNVGFAILRERLMFEWEKNMIIKPAAIEAGIIDQIMFADY